MGMTRHFLSEGAAVQDQWTPGAGQGRTGTRAGCPPARQCVVGPLSQGQRGKTVAGRHALSCTMWTLSAL
ncbi:MAG: hypothetical protein C3F08_02910 [Candidatus Methylomirabilota bacterium]|nr:MAG: hypothetical protein C3F08_02910 [candidate division NC10 bacterium]